MLVDPLDVNDRALDADTRRAVAQEIARAGRVTNMKRILLRSLPAYALFNDVLPLKASLRRNIGNRAVSVFSHAISEGAGCLLCSTYFRRALIEEGISPQSFTPTEEEDDLIALAAVIATPARAMDTDLRQRLGARYQQTTVLELIAYGAAMLATNVLNTTLDVPLDSDLEAFAVSAAPAA
jgi:alkylhydroperoxidase family enzyme